MRKRNFQNWFLTPDSMTFTESGYPIIQPLYDLPEIIETKRFHCANSQEYPEAFISFYTEDYMFERVWNKPELYIPILKRYAGAFSPDFSLFCDLPRPMQQWQHYKKQWCGAYWQSHGISVIPTVGWSDESSFDFCFEGIPSHSVVTISALGCVMDKESKALFLAGYSKMLEVLQPSEILLFGGKKLYKNLEGPVVYIGNSRVVKKLVN